MAIAVVLTVCLVFGSASLFAEEKWYVHYGWTSGYGNDEGILISSEGRVGQITDALFDRFDECPAEVLDSEQIAEIQSLIDQIPETIPSNSHTRLLDHCHDEPEHFVVVSFGNEKQAFQYSKRRQCLNDGHPPDWMASLVEHLESHYLNLKDCEAVSDDQD